MNETTTYTHNAHICCWHINSRICDSRTDTYIPGAHPRVTEKTHFAFWHIHNICVVGCRVLVVIFEVSCSCLRCPVMRISGIALDIGVLSLR